MINLVGQCCIMEDKFEKEPCIITSINKDKSCNCLFIDGDMFEIRPEYLKEYREEKGNVYFGNYCKHRVNKGFTESFISKNKKNLIKEINKINKK